MRSFYSELDYRSKQAQITKNNWKHGVYKAKVRPLVARYCKYKKCSKKFLVKPYESKIYCSKTCSGMVNNQGRILSLVTRAKISLALKNLRPDRRGKHFSKPKVKVICANCKKVFELAPYLSKTQKYCSIHCNIITQGRKTTSPKASKGKNGVRPDIDSRINFYSTWEANIARVYNLIGISWEYAPKIFDLGPHTYRPDFYLPVFNEYVEVKNFMSEYSKERDRLFRNKFPNIKLTLILKEQYCEIKQNYRSLVDLWEN